MRIGGPYFGFWISRGTIALILVMLAFAVLWSLDERSSR